MKALFVSLFGSILINSSFGQFSNERRIYIFGKDSHPELVRQQVAMFDSLKAETKDRDLVMTEVGHGSQLAGRYKVSGDEFCVILIGKDGGEKFRSAKPVLPAKIFAIIDAMPMRRQEMRRKN